MKDSNDKNVSLLGPIKDDVLSHREVPQSRSKSIAMTAQLGLSRVEIASISNLIDQPIGSRRIVTGDVCPNFGQVVLRRLCEYNTDH